MAHCEFVSGAPYKYLY